MSLDTAIQAATRRIQNAARTLPRVVGNEAVNWVKDNFQRQGFPGSTFAVWRRRIFAKRQGPSILIKSGRMKRGVKIITIGDTRVVIGVQGVPYARAHNYGFSGTVSVPSYTRNKYTKSRVGSGKLTKSGKERMKTIKTVSGAITVKAHTRRMNLPKRQFIGASPVLKSILIRAGKLHMLAAIKR